MTKTTVKETKKTATTAIAEKLAKALNTPTAPAAPKAEVKAAPAPAAPVVGQANLTSKRLSQTTLTEYRIVPSQRKTFKGYFIQGGTMRHDATSNRDLFAVCVEIPHTDLAAAKTQLATLKAELAKPVAAAPAAPVAKAKASKKAA
jgi:hypothetical protein